MGVYILTTIFEHFVLQISFERQYHIYKNFSTHTMTNLNEDFNPVYNDPLPPEFAHWSLDLYFDDDEFRAGYPFSDIPEIESNG